MRIALVSPYSWTYPGGVTRHIEALAEQYLAAGHDVRVLSPVDPGRSPDAAPAPRRAPAQRAAARIPRPARPHGRLPVQRRGLERRLRRLDARRAAPRARSGGYDVVHLHEPVAPIPGWDALLNVDAPLVGTFHCYSENAVLQQPRQPLRRAPAAEPPARARSPSPRPRPGPAGASTAAATAIIPNGVDVPAAAAGAARAPSAIARGTPLRIAFIGQAVERKGLPVLLRAFEALREHVPVDAARRRRAPRGARAADARHARRRRARQVQRRGEARRARATPTCCARRRSAARASAWC